MGNQLQSPPSGTGTDKAGSSMLRHCERTERNLSRARFAQESYLRLRSFVWSDQPLLRPRGRPRIARARRDGVGAKYGHFDGAPHHHTRRGAWGWRVQGTRYIGDKQRWHCGEYHEIPLRTRAQCGEKLI